MQETIVASMGIKLKISCFFLFLSLSLALFGQSLQLKEILKEAACGDYLVIEQEKMLTLLRISKNDKEKLVYEEISICYSDFCRQQLSFREWFLLEAPYHVNWTISEIDLTTGSLASSFSRSQNQMLDTACMDPFLSTLFNLEFNEVSEMKRRRIGAPPSFGKEDKRSFWQPPLIVEGKRVSATFTAYSTKWPNDGSNLASKQIEIYLPNATKPAAYPLFFPYFLQIEDKIISCKFRVIDSGINLFHENG